MKKIIGLFLIVLFALFFIGMHGSEMEIKYLIGCCLAVIAGCIGVAVIFSFKKN